MGGVNLSKIIRGLGASNHSEYVSATDDYYATDPIAIDLLYKSGELNKVKYWECACGDGALSKRLEHYGFDVVSTDKVYRGYGEGGVYFLKQSDDKFDGDILTNPPFKDIEKFIKKALKITGRRVYIFGKLQILESQKRYETIFADNPPYKVLVFSKRVPCYRNGDRSFKNGSTVPYAWFIWDNEYNGKTLVDWLI